MCIFYGYILSVGMLGEVQKKWNLSVSIVFSTEHHVQHEDSVIESYLYYMTS